MATGLVITGLTIASAFAAEKGPELTKEDLQEIAQKRNVIKGDQIFWAADETAQRNIEAALGYMIFEKPEFIPTAPRHEYRYQVNPDEALKIKEICLEGANLSDLYFTLSGPGIERRSIYSGSSVDRDLYRDQDGSLILRASVEPSEQIIPVYLKFDLIHSPISKQVIRDTDTGSIMNIFFSVNGTQTDLSTATLIHELGQQGENKPWLYEFFQ